MASCTSIIRRIFSSRPAGTLICSRELVRHCKRKTMDQAIYKMVKRDEIRRIARGVFVRSDSPRYQYSDEEIAKAKARALGKQISNHGSEHIEKSNEGSPTTFSKILGINRDTTQFKTINGTIKLKRCSGRYELLTDDKIGQALKKLWSMGKDKVTSIAIRLATEEFDRTDFADIFARSSLMPYWLLETLREATGSMWISCSKQRLFDMARPGVAIKICA